MSKGYSRNAVNKIAKETAQSGQTYAETYLKFNRILNMDFSCATDAFKNALKKISEAAQSVARAMTELSMGVKK